MIRESIHATAQASMENMFDVFFILFCIIIGLYMAATLAPDLDKGIFYPAETYVLCEKTHLTFQALQ